MAKNKQVNKPLPENYKVLKNGTVYDLDKKRIHTVIPEWATESTLITPENAHEFHSLAHLRRREILKAAAADAVENDALKLRYGASDAWIAEIGIAMQRKATNIDDPKMVDAARFLFQETEIAAKLAAPEPQTVTHVHQMDAATVALLEKIAQAQEVIEVIPMRSKIGDFDK